MSLTLGDMLCLYFALTPEATRAVLLMERERNSTSYILHHSNINRCSKKIPNDGKSCLYSEIAITELITWVHTL